MALKKGSTLPEGDRPWQDCAYAPHCTLPGCVSHKTKTGWAVFCLDHWTKYVERERSDRWIAAGRPTAAQSIAKIKERFGANALKALGIPDRVPGEDDEREAA